MEGDPYPEAAAEIEGLLGKAEGILNGLRNTMDASVVNDARKQLREIAENADDCIQDVAETVRVIATNYQAFGLTEGVYRNREAFVAQSQTRLIRIREATPRQQTQEQTIQNIKDGLAGPSQSTEGHDPDRELEGLLQEHETKVARQNEDLKQLGAAVAQITEVSQTINTELKEQDKVLDKIAGGIEVVTDRIKSTNKKIDKVVEQMSTKKQMCCIGVLVVVLIVLCVLTIA